ncbi:MAG TPA: hypothetical protein VIK33_06610 [Anaerolineae bacterium]
MRIAWRTRSKPILIALAVSAVAVVFVVSLVSALAPNSPNDARPASRLQYVDLNYDTFNADSLNYWELTGDPSGPRWQLVADGQPWGNSYYPDYAMWFGDPATGEFGGEGCDTCPRYSGMLTSKYTLFIPPGDAFAYMTFWSWERTEMSIPSLDCYQHITCTFDLRQVWISGTNPIHSDWAIKWDTQVNTTVENEWHQVMIDISEYIGEDIRIRFTFDTVDGRNNDGNGQLPAGWYVDHLHFFTFTPSHFVYLPIISKQR